MRQLRRDRIDLADLRAVGIVLQYQVVTTGRRLWTRDFDLAEQQEDRIWQLYLTFQDDFKHLWADIKKRGSVYG